MAEQIVTIGSDSELKKVRSEPDHVDTMFTVVTGSMGNQDLNYHLDDDKQGRRTIRQSLAQAQAIDQSPRAKAHSRRSIPLIEMGLWRHSQENEIESNHPRKARFSLPEIDSSNKYEKIDLIKKNHKSFQKTPPPSNSLNVNISEDHPFQRSNKTPLEIPEQCRPELNKTLQHQIECLLPFYTINELAEHNHSIDAWICIFTQIYDITSLIKKVQGTSIYQTLIDHAGQDISLWFDEQTHELRRRIDPKTNQSVLLVPNLSLLESFDPPFWKSTDLLIGRLTEHCRYIRLLHTSSPKQPYVLEVAEEETLGQIARKFLKFNAHIFSYIWQYNGRILDLNRTLTENGLVNEESFHDQFGWRSDNENCPTILLQFSDDLTIA